MQQQHKDVVSFHLLLDLEGQQPTRENVILRQQETREAVEDFLSPEENEWRRALLKQSVSL